MHDAQALGGKCMTMVNKAPHWNEQLRCWCLNFKGRVKLASVKNFQLVSEDDTQQIVMQVHPGLCELPGRLVHAAVNSVFMPLQLLLLSASNEAGRQQAVQPQQGTTTHMVPSQHQLMLVVCAVWEGGQGSLHPVRPFLFLSTPHMPWQLHDDGNIDLQCLLSLAVL